MHKEELFRQVRSSGVLRNKENIFLAETGHLLPLSSSNIEGVLVLTDKRLLFLTKPSIFSNGYDFHSSYKIKDIQSISIVGLVFKSLNIQFINKKYLSFKCKNCDVLRNKILKQRDKKTYQNGAKKYFCIRCKEPIDEKVYNFSKNNLGKPLCRKHQGTKTQKKLFFALKEKGIDCEYEYWDGHKHIDIAIHNAKLLIEVDGKHHYLDPEQFSADLKRTKYSSKEGYITRHFSNREINENVDEIVEVIAEAVNEKVISYN